jgi:hypothetical protein
VRREIEFARVGIRQRAFLLLVPSCLLVACGAGNASTSATRHSATASSTPPPPAATTPPGGPAPAQLLGDWRLGPNASNAIDLALYASTFSFTTSGDVNLGDIVVNGNEIDFFNGDGCGLTLPDGVGRYTWNLQNNVLHFTPLNQDPCGMRSGHLADQSYAKTSG